jgi:hypothetical protein
MRPKHRTMCAATCLFVLKTRIAAALGERLTLLHALHQG